MALNPLIGIGLRHPHYRQVIEERPTIGWLEVHSENFFDQGGPALDALIEISKYYPISLHGVGLSLGSADGIKSEHLVRFKRLIQKVGPFMISEHLSWNSIGGRHLPDLLPVPYTEESLAIFARNVSAAQDALQRELLIENPSSYLEYQESSIPEADFLVALCRQTGSKILLDVNNIFVSCRNHNWNADLYIESIPIDMVEEIHIAGHSTKALDTEKTLLIDTHDNTVCSEVWELYGKAIKRFGPTYTLLEWDAQIPELYTLINEVAKAENYLFDDTRSCVNA